MIAAKCNKCNTYGNCMCNFNESKILFKDEVVIEKIKLYLYNKITEIKTDSGTDNVFIKTYDDGRVRGLEIAIELINKII
jgi:hypothetical protein